MKIITDCLTGIDGKTYDPARVALAMGVMVFLGLAIKDYAAFDPNNFGIGFGALVGGSGLGVMLKAKTEPGA